MSVQGSQNIDGITINRRDFTRDGDYAGLSNSIYPTGEKTNFGIINNITNNSYTGYETYANPFDFGAIGDGITDDTLALSGAINSSATTIIANSGTFLVKDIPITQANKVINLNAKVKLKAQAAGEYGCIFIQQAPNITYKNIHFDGNKSNQTGNMLSDAYFNGSNQGRAARCAIRNSGYDGIYVDSCRFENVYGGQVVLYHVSDVTVHNCYSSGCQFELLYSNNPDTLSHDYMWTNCKIYDLGSNDASVNGNAGILYNVSGGLIANNYFDTVERNFCKLGGDSGHYVQNILVADNVGNNTTVADFAAFQIQDNSENVSFVNNTLTNVYAGIMSDEAGVIHKNLKILGNTLVGHAGTSDGVRFASHMSGSEISHNTIKNFRYGIRVESKNAAVKHINIDHNDISSPNKETAILLNASNYNIENMNITHTNIHNMASAVANGCVRMTVDAADVNKYVNFTFNDNKIYQNSGTHRAIWIPESGCFSGYCEFARNYIEGTVLLASPTSQLPYLPVLWKDNTVLGTASVPDVLQFAANDTTPSVAYGESFKTANTAPTIISDFDDAKPGALITVLINDGNTQINFTSGSLKGNGIADLFPGVGDMLICKYVGTTWYCSYIQGS